MDQPAGRNLGTYDLSGGVPWVESPFFAEELKRRAQNDEQRQYAEAFNRDGYVVVEKLIDRELADRITPQVAHMLEHDPYSRQERRVHDLWKTSPEVKSIVTHPRIMELLHFLYGRRPIPFQTINFKFGSQQKAHADAIHFSGIPEQFMCGVWVALEDVSPDNGPLFYYPGSQKLPAVMPYHMGMTADTFSYTAYEEYQAKLMEALEIKPVEFHAKAGDALVWSANVIHGGRPILKEGSTRWSQVTHYFFEDCIYLTPMQSNMDLGEFQLRNKITNIATGQKVHHSYNGQKVWTFDLPNGRSLVHLSNTSGRALRVGVKKALKQARGIAGRAKRSLKG